jgi:hypothetical protein
MIYLNLWEILISSGITVIISIVGWVIAFKQINKQHTKSVQIEKDNYKYELKQKVAFEVLDKNIAFSQTFSGLKAIVETNSNDIAFYQGEFFKKNLIDEYNEYRTTFSQLHNQMYGKKIILKDLNYLFTELTELNGKLSNIYWDIIFLVDNQKSININDIKEKCILISNIVDKLNEINNDIVELLQKKYILNIFE